MVILSLDCHVVLQARATTTFPGCTRSQESIGTTRTAGQVQFHLKRCALQNGFINKPEDREVKE
jgi:hypothetical protein